jgi:phosphoglycolate phosphatase
MTIDLPKPRALLFDWDGTLIDNWDAIVSGLNEALVTYGQSPWGRDEAMERISASQRDSFPVLFGDDWQQARDIFYAGFERRHLELLTVLDGAEALLDCCKPVLTALVSNKSGRHLRKEAEHLGWTPRFHALVGATDAERDKPDPAPVHLALQGSGITPGPDVWFIGDSGTDLKTARASGCTAIIVRHAAANPAALPPDLSPDLTVPHLDALQQALVKSLGVS